MKIKVRQTETMALYDFELEAFKCTHPEAIIEKACCSTLGRANGVDCACQGREQVYCYNCNNEDMSAEDAFMILVRG